MFVRGKGAYVGIQLQESKYQSGFQQCNDGKGNDEL